MNAQGKPRTGLGICVYALMIRQRVERSRGRDLDDPLTFLEECHARGAGGIQTPLGIRSEEYSARLRGRAEELGMSVEGIVELPRNRSELERLERELDTARAAGVETVRCVMIPGRRYERFEGEEELRRFAKQGVDSLERAEPVASRRRVRLAVENHKDQRIPERLEVLERLSSEHVGACVDTGNSFALLEDPMEAIEAYAPWALTVHLKDQAVREYDKGFLLADVALGDGFLDLKRMVGVLRKARPGIGFYLETITRDPLEVPCLERGYWATLRDVPARDLARTLRIVRESSARELPAVSHLPVAEQLEAEERTVRRSLEHAREELGL